MTNDRINAPPPSTSSTSSTLVETRFIPRQYEPNYAYPLLVLFHPRGGDEDQLVRAMPALSWRNYVALGLRGPEPVIKRDGLAGFGWGREFGLHDRCSPRRKVEPLAADRRVDVAEWVEWCLGCGVDPKAALDNLISSGR